jgi:tRNA nucleotidyltransferase/poly(A) polymerase
VTTAPASLGRPGWLTAGQVQAIFSALAGDDEEIRIVGGAVRNALIGAPVTDIDFATTARPEIVKARAEAAGFKVVPTGADHGTLTVVADGHAYEVTTLREDVETDGRRAVVRFGRDWLADASRRDFTVNALYVDAIGSLFDPLDGYNDLVAGRIRFIGPPERRIEEDRLRILRFFRFHAQYGKGALDEAGLSASIRARDGLRVLSAERIGREMRLLAVAGGAAATLTTMQEAGILPVVLGGVGYVVALQRLVAFEAVHDIAASAPLRLAAIGCRIEEDVLRIAGRMRLPNVERDRMLAAVRAAGALRHKPDGRAARRLLYRLGQEAYGDGVALGFCWSGGNADDQVWGVLRDLPRRWQAPSFPLSGRDIVGQTKLHGAAVGTLLRQIESWWIDGDFAADEATLRQRLQQMVVAMQ